VEPFLCGKSYIYAAVVVVAVAVVVVAVVVCRVENE